MGPKGGWHRSPLNENPEIRCERVTKNAKAVHGTRRRGGTEALSIRIRGYVRCERLFKYVRTYVRTFVNGLHGTRGRGAEPKPSLSESGDTLRESDEKFESSAWNPKEAGIEALSIRILGTVAR